MTAKGPKVKQSLGEAGRPRPVEPLAEPIRRESPLISGSGPHLPRMAIGSILTPSHGWSHGGRIAACDHEGSDRGGDGLFDDVGRGLRSRDDAGDIGVFPGDRRALGLLAIADFSPFGLFALPFLARQFLPSLLEWIDTRSHESGGV
jgi:hypothetical protein